MALKLNGLKKDAYTLYLAVLDARTPWYAKVIAVLTVAYVISPIDLIPDFIPFIGHLDDLIVLATGMWIVKKLVPANVIEECERKAEAHLGEFSARVGRIKWIVWTVVVVSILLWLVVLTLLGLIVYHLIKR